METRRRLSVVVLILALSGALFTGCSGSSTAPSSSTPTPPVQTPVAPADPVVVTPPTVASAINLHYNEGLTAEVVISDAVHTTMQMIATCVSWRPGYVMLLCGAADVSKGVRQSDGTWKYTVSGATVNGRPPENSVSRTIYFGAIALPTYTIVKPGFYDPTKPDVPEDGLDRPLGIQWLPLEVNWTSAQSLIGTHSTEVFKFQIGH